MKLFTLLFLCFTVFSPNISAFTSPEMDRDVQQTYPNAWQKLKLKGLNLFRLEVPNGWLVREGFGKMAGLGAIEQTRMMLFIEDPDHAWRTVADTDWELHRLKGLNLHRLMVPGGWLVREGWGKFGSEYQIRLLTFVPDPEHKWHMEPRR